MDMVGQSSIISKLDITKGFHQIPVKEYDRSKTAFVCPIGKFQYKCMPLDLTNAPACFQQTIELALSECVYFARPYIDDMIAFSRGWKSHVNHIDQVLSALREVGFTANSDNCEWGGCQLLYLGRVVGNGRLAVPEDRAIAMRETMSGRSPRRIYAASYGVSILSMVCSQHG